MVYIHISIIINTDHLKLDLVKPDLKLLIPIVILNDWILLQEIMTIVATIYVGMIL